MDFTEYQSSQDNTTAMGDLFERLVQLYLLTSPEFESKIENVWWPKFQKLPEGLKEDLNLTFPDEGIDLVAKTRDGNYWPIQAKYESDTAGAKTKKNLTSFSTAAFVAGENMSFGIVAHTKAKPIRKRRLLESEKKGYKIIEWGLAHWLELSDLDWLAIRTKAAGKSHRPKRRTPHPHQKLAIQKAKTHFINRAADRGRLIMPCASGKSLTAFWIAKEIDASTIVIALPSLSLIKQTVKDWTRELTANRENPTWICICSDKTVGELDDADNDIFVKDLYDLGLPVTTTATQIIGFLKDSSASKKIIFTTYVSSPILAEACKSANVSIDFCVFDEAHKTAGRKNKRAATLLNNSAISIKKRLFMTATERFLSGSGNNEKAYSMGDETVYGACFHSLSFKAAIDQGIICDYKIITVSVAQPEIQKLLDERELLQDEEGGSDIFDASSLAAGIALEKVQKRYRAKHAISFHKSIAAAKAFKTQQLTLARMGLVSQKINYSHINGSLSAGERSDLMAKFVSAKQAVITNAKCLTEGVDVPSIDCVLFASPKQSVVDIVQAAGRAMRPDPTNNKQFGYVVIPIAIPEDMGLEEFASTTEFRTVAKQITALSTQDERIAEYFRLKENMEASSNGPIEIIGEVPVGMAISFEEFASEISTKVWDKVAKVNWRPFKEARTFVRNLGLENNVAWHKYSKSGKRPADIPGNPNKIYKDDGWIGSPDWLGNGNIDYSKVLWASYETAREYAIKNNVITKADWVKLTSLSKFPVNIPKVIEQYYIGNGWIDWFHFTGRGKKNYVSYEDARILVKDLKIKTEAAWRKLPRDSDIFDKVSPAPANFYKDKGWVSWTHFFFKDRVDFLEYEEARLKSRGMECKSVTEWKAATKDMPEFPSYPARVYAAYGFDWSDFLATPIQQKQKRIYMTFNECRKLMVTKGIRTKKQFDEIKNELAFNIPRAPHHTYRDKGFKNFPHFFGQRDTDFLKFVEARARVRRLEFKSVKEYQEASSARDLPDRLPSNPSSYYKGKGWINWTDFLKGDS